MTVYNKAAVGRFAKEKGFPRDTFEKVLRLKEVLAFINSDDFLRKHLVFERRNSNQYDCIRTSKTFCGY